MPVAAERRPEAPDETRAIDRAAIERLLTRRDVSLREKTLWRMLYETAARASEIYWNSTLPTSTSTPAGPPS